MPKETKTAIIKTINGDFSVEFANSRDFLLGVRNSIERGNLYEFSHGNTRTLINAKNIVSIEMEADALGSFASPFKSSPAITPPTPEEEAENQAMLQPLMPVFEAKKRGMEKMKAKEDAVRQKQFDDIYGKK